MNKIEKLFTALCVFFYLMTFVYAQDFSLHSGKFYELKEGEEKIEFEFYNGSYNICENEKKTIPLLIVNKDKENDNRYSLDLIGASWINLNVKEFSMPKKQSGVVFLDLNPTENTNGRYNIRISGLSSIGNVKKDLSIDVNVEKCYAISLELEKEEDNVCGGVKKQYSGEITNGGKQKSEIELTINGPNWISVDKYEFSINPNDKEKFELSSDAPPNAKGHFNVIVNAVIKNLPSIKSEKELSIEVVPKYDCYKAEIIADTLIKNYYSNDYVPIKIRNDGIKQAEYKVSLEAPNWISSEPKELTINPEQFGNLNLNINPSSETADGTYPIKLHVKSEDIFYSKNINIVLSKDRFREVKSSLIFYRYYIYIVLFGIVILFLSRKKIKIAYKNYKIKRARLKTLEAARKARLAKMKQRKKEVEEIKKEQFKFEFKKIKREWIYFFIGLIAIILFLLFSIYEFDFPVSKEFVKNYYLYFIAGIVISFFIILVIEFYKIWGRRELQR